MSVKYTVDKIAAFVDGCTNEADVPVLARPGHHWPLALCTGRYERGPAG